MSRSSARIRSGGGSRLMSEAALSTAQQQTSVQLQYEAVNQPAPTKSAARRGRKRAAPASGAAAGDGGSSGSRRRRGSAATAADRRESVPVTPCANPQAAETVAAVAVAAAPLAAAPAAKPVAKAKVSPPTAVPTAEPNTGTAAPSPPAEMTPAEEGTQAAPAPPADEEGRDPGAEAAAAAAPEDGDSSFDEDEEDQEQLARDAEDDALEVDGEEQYEAEEDPGNTSQRSEALNAEFDRAHPRLQVGYVKAGDGQLKLCLGGATGAAAAAVSKPQEDEGEERPKPTAGNDEDLARRPLHPFFSRPAGGAAPSRAGPPSPASAASSQAAPAASAAVPAQDAGQHWSAFWRAKTGGAAPSARSQAAATALQQGGQRTRRRLSAAAARSSGGSRFAECPCCGRSVAVSMLDDHLDRCGIASEETAPADSGADAADAGPASAGAAARALPAAGAQRDATAMPPPSTQGAEAPSSSGSESRFADCPICQKRVAVDFMSQHIDNECSGGSEAQNNSTGASDASRGDDNGWTKVAKEWSARWDALGKELACSICLCLFEEPCTLPCQHSFCKCVTPSRRPPSPPPSVQSLTRWLCAGVARCTRSALSPWTTFVPFARCRRLRVRSSQTLISRRWCSFSASHFHRFRARGHRPSGRLQMLGS